MTPFRLSILAVAAAALVACGGSGGSSSDRGELLESPVTVMTMTVAQIDAATESVGLKALTGQAQCDVKVVALNYTTVGAHGEGGANSSGVMLVPEGDADRCAANAPLLAYARGTEFTRQRTMANPQDTETLMLIAFYASQGYAVVATDYLGYAKSDYAFHPYLHADSEATAVLDSIRAARHAAGEVGARLSGDVLFSGYSQGGHASMAAQRAAEREGAGEFRVVAAGHLAGPYNMAAAMTTPVAVAGYQYFSPFIITSWQKVYGNLYTTPDEVFRAPYAAWIEDLLPSATYNATTLMTEGKLPWGTPEQARDALMQPSFLNNVLADDAAPVNVAARANTLFNWKPVAPVLLCGGAGDPTVPPALHQVPMMDNFDANGVENVVSVDVDGFIQAAYGPAPTDPASPEYSDYYGDYHGSFEPPFCFAAARNLFEQMVALEP